MSGVALSLAFGGSRRVLLNIQNDSVFETADGPIGGAVSATYTLNPDGTVSTALTWFTPPKPLGSLYDVKATLLSGTLFSGTVGAWLNLGTAHSWASRSNTGGGIASVLLEVAYAGTTTVLDSATIGLTAEYNAV
jgi:hypothetical protein